METTAYASRPQAFRFFGEAALIIVALVLAFAAFDDITTGNETDFTAEYVAALGCAVCLLFASIRLMQHRRYLIGAISLTALAGAIWAEHAIQPSITPGLWPEYVVVLGAFIWFAAIALQLLVLGWTRLSDPGYQASSNLVDPERHARRSLRAP